VLIPELRYGDVIIMDNLSSPEGAKGTQDVASLLYLPPYSPLSTHLKCFVKSKISKSRKCRDKAASFRQRPEDDAVKRDKTQALSGRAQPVNRPNERMHC
jgi:hypothetical protein